MSAVIVVRNHNPTRTTPLNLNAGRMPPDMDTPIISEKQARSYKMTPVTQPSPKDGEFIQSVIRDMERVRGTVWALVRPEDPAFDQSPNFVEVWRKPIKLP
jgi:hypothetical protein